MTDWAAYLACEVCEAKMGGACFTLLSGGPEALPPRYADVPHSSRKLRGQVATAKPAVKVAGPRTANPARRTAKRQAATASSWAAVARRQGKI